MAGFRVRVLQTTAAVAFAASAALVAAAPASAALSYVESGNTNTAAGNQGTSTVNCPSSSFVVGGGAYSTGGFGAVAITSSLPTGNAGWREFTDVYEGTQGHRAFAICDTTMPTVRFAKRTVKAGSEKTVRAACQAGEHVYGGGSISSISFGETITPSSRPYLDEVRGDGWKATVFSKSGDHEVTAYALCGLLDTTLRTRTVEVAKKSQGFAQKRCGSGDQVTGGGGAIAVGGGKGWISTTYPRDTDSDATPDDAWGAYLENTSSKKREITAYAICR